MKKPLRINDPSNTVDFALLVARIGIAALMLSHGIPKLPLLFSGAADQYTSVLGMGEVFTLGFSVFIEVLGALFLLVGFGTRITVIPLIISMLAAAFFVHGTDPLYIKQAALLYLLFYIVLFYAGSGKYSVDFILRNKKAKTYANHSKPAKRDFTVAY